MIGVVYSILVFWPLTIINIVVGSLLFRFMGLLQGDEGRLRVFNTWGGLQLLFALANIKIEGAENIPSEGGVVFCSNHRSYVDIFLIASASPRNLHWVIKEVLTRYPVLGGHLKRWGIALDRSEPRAAARELLAAAKQLKSGQSVIVFPEGTRSEGEMLPFKTGVFALAQKAAVPIVPIALSGTGNLLPARSLWVHPGKTVKIKFLKALWPHEWTEDRQGLSDRVKNMIERELS